MAYEELRALPLREVLARLGFQSEWREAKGGTEWRGRCPLHNPKRNVTSFSFDNQGRFNCLSCHELHGRGAIDLVMQIQRVGFQEAVSWLQGVKIEPAIPTPKLVSIEPPTVTISENPAFNSTYDKFYVPSDWLGKRGLLKSTLDHFGVGQYENPKRRSVYSGSVMLPIRRYSDGECVGYLSRNIGQVTPEKPKYILPKGLHKQLELWGSYELKDQAPIRIVYIVESAFSVMHFHQLGFPAVALLGWTVSPQQIEILANLAKGVVFLPDSDKQKEAQQYVGHLATKLWVKYPLMPVSDPEQLTEDQIKLLTHSL